MEKYGEMVRRALAAYLERGQEALRMFAAGRPDDARAMLRWRKAAFHNFRAHDARALAAGWDAATDPRVQELLASLRCQEPELRAAIAAAREAALTGLRRTRTARQTLNGYRSSRSQGTRVVDTA